MLAGEQHEGKEAVGAVTGEGLSVRQRAAEAVAEPQAVAAL